MMHTETKKDVEMLKKYLNERVIVRNDLPRLRSLAEVGYIKMPFIRHGRTAFTTDLGKKFLSLIYFRYIFCYYIKV
jgi:hypothetical protein